MAAIVIKIPTANAAQLGEFTSDDTVSRQSITTREAEAIGLEGDFFYVRITGGDEGVAHAKQLAQESKLGDIIEGDEAQPILDAIAEGEDAAAEGMGFIDF